jgi:DNA repair protein RadD
VLPRPFQADLLERARDAIRAGNKRVLVQLPTGGGKTFIAALMMKGMRERGRRSYFLAHRKELLKQTSDTFCKVGLDHGFIARGKVQDDSELTQLVALAYAARRKDILPRPTNAIIDEAHHAVAREWAELLDHWDCLQIGLSATPERLDGRGLGDRFDVMVKGPTPRWLIDNGYLSEFKLYAPSGDVDLGGVKTTAGDFNSGQLEAVMGNADLIGDVVKHYRELADGQPGIVFAVSREHSASIARAFQAAGIAAAHIDGTMGDRERDAIVGAFRDGRLKVLSNVDLFGEGFDVPGIVYCGLCRPTKSLSLYLQQCGRALRVFEGKEHAVICDHAGNAFRHGLPDDVRDWRLDAVAKQGKGKSDAKPVHQCPLCYQVTFSQRRQCPCGYVFPIAARSIAWAEGELFELQRDVAKKEQTLDKAALRKAEEKACRTFDELYDLAIRRGYDNPRGWAKMRLDMRRGKLPGGKRFGGRR